MNVTVKVTKRYNDRQKKKIMEVGDSFEVSKERADRLVKHGVAEIVKETEKKTDTSKSGKTEGKE